MGGIRSTADVLRYGNNPLVSATDTSLNHYLEWTCGENVGKLLITLARMEIYHITVLMLWLYSVVLFLQVLIAIVHDLPSMGKFSLNLIKTCCSSSVTLSDTSRPLGLSTCFISLWSTYWLYSSSYLFETKGDRLNFMPMHLSSSEPLQSWAA